MSTTITEIYSASGFFVWIWWPDWPTIKVILVTQSCVSIKALDIWHGSPIPWRFLRHIDLLHTNCFFNLRKMIFLLTQNLKHSDLHLSFQYAETIFPILKNIWVFFFHPSCLPCYQKTISHLQLMPDILLLPDTSLLNNIIYNTLTQKMHQLR